MADRIEWVCLLLTPAAKAILTTSKMDQRPYPGPPPLFHIRIMSLFCVLALTDLVMFLFAYQSIMQNDIGATILFANEVGDFCYPYFHMSHPCKVRDSCCQCLECVLEVQSYGLRVTARINPRRRRCPAMGSKEYMDILH